MKSILFITINEHVPWGGSEELWFQSAMALRKFHDIHVVVRKWEKDPAQLVKLKEIGVNIHYKEAFSDETFFRKFKRKMNNNSFHPLSFLPSIPNIGLVILSLGDHSSLQLPTYTKFLHERKIPYAILVQLATDLRFLTDYRIKNLLLILR